MTPRRKLASALQEAAKPARTKTRSTNNEARSPSSSSSESHLPPSRRGKKAITCYFDPAVSRQLKQISLDQERTVNEIVGEALNDLFVKHRKNPIA